MDTQVLIVGAGPTGLVLACDLARRGIAVRLVERAAEPFTGSRGKGLQPRSLEVFDDLGLAPRLLAESADYPLIRRYAAGAVVWEGRMHEPAEPTAAEPYPNIQMLPQARTEALLRERLTELGGRVELGTELVDLSQDDTGVHATLATAGGTEQVRAEYLVGADGGRSTVRKRLGVGFEGDTYETERMLVGDVRVAGLGRECWHIWVRPEQPERWVALCPLPGTESFQFAAPAGTDEEPEPTLARLQELVDQATGGAELRLHDLTWISLYRPNVRMVDRFRVDRVFLAGDAAHVHSPAGGQGLNTGVQDAYNLGWKLAAVLDGAPAELLDTYEEERLPVAAGVLGISTRLHRARSHRRGAETNQLGIGYRGASLSDDNDGGDDGDGDGGDALRAGDRAPDGRCHTGDGSRVRLFDLFRGPHWTLLTVNPAAGAPTDAPAGVRAFAVSGCDYRVPAGSSVLVRPDGYIGLITTDPERVSRYLALAGSPRERAAQAR